MLEGIAFALIKTMITFMFEQYLYTTQEIEIDDAPSWYYQNSDKMICSFSVIDGDYVNIELLKSKLLEKLQKDIQDINSHVIYKNFDRITNQIERDIVNKFENMSDVSKFIKFNINYNKIEYRSEVNRVFGKACIEKSMVLSFNKERLKNIVREVSIYKSSIEFDELETGKSQNSYFQELENGF